MSEPKGKMAVVDLVLELDGEPVADALDTESGFYDEPAAQAILTKLAVRWNSHDALTAQAALVQELAAVLRLVKRKWTFNNDQQHTHTWHAWADCIGPIDAALAKVQPKGA